MKAPADAEEAKLERELHEDATHRENAEVAERVPFSKLDLTAPTARALALTLSCSACCSDWPSSR